ncbi:MAG: FAD-dependent oxidoreductase [Runella slithyformis]|nr:MAG: FAD-dependent oxidoreductase [Runella slithyformis]TAF22916.1 MAG: FAD-dependent oxidoreductase [Runella slithyformis]TAF49183.1 MAG: FAD-dependent oxidoreductase [Runella slithyformis]
MTKIIIVGAGTAGMACAIRAAECGAQVVIIEKDSQVGGTLHLTAGHMSAGGTKRQAERGIVDSPQQHYDDVMRISNHTANPDVVRLATQLAPQTIDWLQENGFPFEPNTPQFIYGHTPYQTARTHWGTTSYSGTEIKWAGSAIFDTMKPLWDKYVTEGKIELHLNTRMVSIAQEGNGWEVAIEKKVEEEEAARALQSVELKNNNATTARAAPSKLNTQNVVLTTGGYGSNPDFFHKMHPNWRLVSTARHTSTGDGALAAMAVGAQFWNADKHTATLGGLETEPNSGRTDFWKNWGRVSNSMDRKPREIYVNAHGRRFMDENLNDPDPREKAAEAQPDRKFWVIFDEKALHEEGGCLIPQWAPDRLAAEAENGVFAWKANSISELAKKTRLDEGTLEQTVARFNTFVTHQRDEDFGRTYLQNTVSQAPFYAILTHCFSLVTFGGLAVNAQLQVIDNQQQPIEGLYAAGEIVGGGATCGHAFVGGMFLTPALSFGRYLGQKLATF